MEEVKEVKEDKKQKLVEVVAIRKFFVDGKQDVTIQGKRITVEMPVPVEEGETASIPREMAVKLQEAGAVKVVI